MSLREELLDPLDYRLGRRIEPRDQLLHVLARTWLDVGLDFYRLAEEFGILHRGIEPPPQQRGLAGRQPGRGGERPRHCSRPDHQLDELAILVLGEEVENEWRIREFGGLLHSDLDQNIDLLVAQPVGLGGLYGREAEGAAAVRFAALHGDDGFLRAEIAGDKLE